jgi:hypothetical protein
MPRYMGGEIALGAKAKGGTGAIVGGQNSAESGVSFGATRRSFCPLLQVSENIEV